MKGRGKNISESEIAFIYAHCKEMTLRQMCTALGRGKSTVFQFYQKHGLEWNHGIRTKRLPEAEKKPKVYFITEPKPEPVKQRPPAIYTNRMSPYGIADELHRNPNSYCSI